MSFIDLMGNHRWTLPERRARTEALLADALPPEAERIMLRRALGLAFYAIGQMLPPGHPFAGPLGSIGQPLTPDKLGELMAAAQALAAVDAEADQADRDIALLNRVLDCEEGGAPLAEDDSLGLALLAQREAARAALDQPQSAPEDEARGEVAA